VVVGVDSLKGDDGDYQVKQYTGDPAKSRSAGHRTLDWVREAAERGAGEIVLNCMSRDGVRTGYDVEHTAAVLEAVSIPVIASGGAGTPAHFRDVLAAGASGALAATVFHDRVIAIPTLKEYLSQCGIAVRP
jgi:cyclase